MNVILDLMSEVITTAVLVILANVIAKILPIELNTAFLILLVSLECHILAELKNIKEGK